MKDTWETRIARAEQLAGDSSSTAPLLAFYAKVLRVQHGIDGYLRAEARRATVWRAKAGRSVPTGLLENDLPILRPMISKLLEAVAQAGPEQIAKQAEQLLPAGDRALDAELLAYWCSPTDTSFFAKALLQPYAAWLADSGVRPAGRNPGAANRCPFCGGKPQLAVLHTADPAGEGGGRTLFCTTCLSAWPFGRVLCANCGETAEPRLGYFQAPDYPHVRVEACDTCRHYLKSIDLSRLGVAVPLVDEIAAAALDLWAREQGYVKIELNLVGM